ncbi:hypothetical protein AURDEDRAFT_171580 [Auricularia subglabra TFB-10046 SS5]|nr:hypothetical protein AURDEDRAFT_171580 [Auricularia subglabra TFB-10046 SS5]
MQYLGDVQYVDPRLQHGFIPPHQQSHFPAGYQQHQPPPFTLQGTSYIAPPPQAAMQYGHVPSAPTSPTAADFAPEQQQYSVPPTPYAHSTFYDHTNAHYAEIGYQESVDAHGQGQQNHFHASVLSMHQGNQMVAVTQENISQMPPRLMTMTHGVLMRAPEMIDVTV